MIGATITPTRTPAFASVSTASSRRFGVLVRGSITRCTSLFSDVIDWYSNSANNHGWELISSLEGTAQSVKAFYSKEFTSDPTRWPKLTVTYVPEPTAGMLALLASPLWLFYRRR